MGLYSLRKIIQVHYLTVLEESNSKRKVYLIFLGIPILGAGIILLMKMEVTTSILTAMVSMLAILIGFSINSVFLLMGGGSDDPSKDEIELFENTRNITLYSIIVGLFSLVLAGIVLIGLSNNIFFKNHKSLVGLTSLLFFLLTHYILTLFLLPARLYVIVELTVLNRA